MLVFDAGAVALLILLGSAATWLVASACRYRSMILFRLSIGAEARAFIHRAETAGDFGYPPNWLAEPTDERGIVVCAGGASLLAQAYTTLDAIRNLHSCDLPAAIFYAGKEEMTPRCARLFEERFAPLVCIDATALASPPAHRPAENLRGYPLKAFAHLNAPFNEVLALDADSTPLQDPSYLFESTQYRKFGNVFWPDTSVISTVVHHPSRTRIYSFLDGNSKDTVQSLNPRIFDYLQLPRPCTPQRISYETEAAQILIDRRACFRAVQMAWFINSRSRFFYRYMHGDKDTYRLAFGIAGQPFCQVEHQSHQGGVIREGRFLGKAVIQRDPLGKPLFLHQTHRKPDLMRPWIPITHVVEDSPADHPRRREERGISMNADAAALHSIEPVDGAIARLDEFICQSLDSLRSEWDRGDLFPQERKPWLDRRILPW